MLPRTWITLQANRRDCCNASQTMSSTQEAFCCHLMFGGLKCIKLSGSATSGGQEPLRAFNQAFADTFTASPGLNLVDLGKKAALRSAARFPCAGVGPEGPGAPGGAARGARRAPAASLA